MLAEGQHSAAVAPRQRHKPRQQQPGLTASPGTLHETPYAMDFKCSGELKSPRKQRKYLKQTHINVIYKIISKDSMFNILEH